jgi:ribosome-associated toxin RatA of RatAB toxin-antitoxin module
LLTKRSFLIVACGLLVLSPVASAQSNKELAYAPDSNSAVVTVSKKKRGARGITAIQINAPRAVVWDVLTDFQRYPRIFKRIQSCRVTKREGDLVFTESCLKPQLFVQEPVQHAINDLGKAPCQLNWRALDGNFKAMDGTWELSPLSGDRCLATYTLEVDPGNLVPGPLVAVILHGMQKEITAQLKRAAEIDYKSQVRTSTAQIARPGEG